MSALNRQTSKSTELLHVTSPESSGGGARRSWDSLVVEKRPDTAGLNCERLDRARFSVCGGGGGGGGGQGTSTPPASWFGGPSLQAAGDQSPRILGTMPRNVVALLDRPVTYEEELEDRMGLLKVSATTLCQRLAGERKKATELAKQLQARELSHRGTIEKMREQYDLRFERLKSRARLLVRRCEFLRNERQMADQRLAQVIESGARERQVMERRIAALQEEIDRMKNEKDERRDIIQAPRETEGVDDVRREEEKRRKASQLNGSNNGLDGENFKILCEIAVARVSLLENWVATLNSDRSTMTMQEQQQLFGPPPSLTRRTSSCPMIAVSSPFSLSDNESLHSNENQPGEESQTPASPASLAASPASLAAAAAAAAVEPGSPNPSDGGGGSIDRTAVVLRRPGDHRSGPGVPPPRRPLANVRSMPPTTGHALPILPSTIRISLQKLFHGGKSNQNDASSVARDAARRFETLSDDEFHSEAKSDRRRRPKRGESGGGGGGEASSPCPSAKRHSSLPKDELLKKFQQHGVGTHDPRGPDPSSRSATLPATADSAPKTREERIHGGPATRVVDHLHSSADDIRFTRDEDNDHHRCLREGEGGGATTSVGRTDCRANRNSTESLPDIVEDSGKGEDGETKAVKRHLSVHSTFDRLHQRRNGLANVDRIETKKKSTKSRSTSAFDNFGKNLKQYLH